MNTENLLDQIRTLKMSGMLEAFHEQLSQPKHADLSFEERLGLLLDREILTRENRRINNLQRRAKFRQIASIEDVCYKSKRGLDEYQTSPKYFNNWSNWMWKNLPCMCH